VEGPQAVQNAKNGDQPCTLIVVPLDRNDLDSNDPLEQDLGTFQTATRNAKPVLDFTPRHKGWQEVEHSIRKAVVLRRQQTG